MNKRQLLDYMRYICGSGNECADEPPPREPPDLNDKLFELYSRRTNQVVYPPTFSKDNPDKAIRVLRKTYKDDVTKISCILNHCFPDRFLFYRVSKLDNEIFEGLDFFSDCCPEFQLPFDRLARNDFDHYLQLNDALFAFGRQEWPEAEALHYRVLRFLCDHLAWLFVHACDYDRYWINNTSRDPGDEEAVNWSGRKEMQPGDLVFMYQMAPVKAITSLFRVQDFPEFDPWGAWDGFWVNLERVCKLPEIGFGEMRNHSILAEWSVIRRNFQGVVTEPVPHACYNALLELLPDSTKGEFGLKLEPVSDVGASSQFSSEADYEKAVIEPLLKQWGFQFKRQLPCKCYFGTQQITGRVDFLISDTSGTITLFEDKLRILNDEQLKTAVNQGKSYALMLGLPSFVVASPEGMKLYSLSANQENLVIELANDNKTAEEAFRREILRLAGR